MSGSAEQLKKSSHFRLFAKKIPTSKPILLNHKRVFILPTRRGMGFVLLIVVLVMIAFVYNNNLAYLLAFLLASVFFVTILHSFKALSGLVIEKGRAESVYAGQDAQFEIALNNPVALERFSLQLKLLDFEVSLNMKAREKKRVRLSSPTYKRGWQPCEKIILSSHYPLGLFRAWSILYFDFSALIYPKPSTENLPFPETAGSEAQQGASHALGQEDFYGLKEYQAGDSIRHIHWKAYAKGQGLYTKQYSGETLAELWLTYEATQGHHLEQRLSQLCRWLIEADNAGLEYGFELPSLRLEPSSGTAHFQKCLHALALF